MSRFTVKIEDRDDMFWWQASLPVSIGNVISVTGKSRWYPDAERDAKTAGEELEVLFPEKKAE